MDGRSWLHQHKLPTKHNRKQLMHFCDSYTGTKRSTFGVDTFQWGRSILLQDLFHACKRYYFPEESRKIQSESDQILFIFHLQPY